MKLDKGYFKNIVVYSCMFLFLSFIIIFIMSIEGVSFVYNGDAFVQHFPSQIYIGEYLSRLGEFFKSGFERFNFNIGLGQDVLSTYHYYGLTDPLSAIFLIKSINAIDMYTLKIFLRIYLAGISFIIMCEYFKADKKSINSALGAIIYAFSNYALTPGMMHPFFINAMIFLPIMIIGVNRLVYKNKILLFVVIFSLSLIVNVYLSIILSITAFVYALVCIIDLFKKKGFSCAMKYFTNGIFSYLIAFFISGIISFPVIYSIITNSIRNIENKVELPFIMSKNELILYFYGLFKTPNSNNFALVGISIIVLFTIIDLFINKENWKLKIISILTLLLIISPKIHKVFGGFLYDNYRWYFIVVLLLSYIFVMRIDSMIESKKYKKIALCIISIFIISAYAYKTFLRYLNNENLQAIKSKTILIDDMLPIILSITIIIAILFIKNVKYKKTVIFSVVLFSISINMLVYAKQNVYSNVFVKRNILNEKLVKYNKYEDLLTSKDDFFRVDNPNTAENNYSDIFKYNSIPINYSIENKNFSKFNLEYINTGAIPITVVRGFDSRSILNGIVSTKYFLGKSKMPYGYEKKYDGLYENKYFLPFGYTYDKYVRSNEISNLDVLKKQEILLNACIVDGEKNYSLDTDKIELLSDDFFRKSNLLSTTLDFKPYKNITIDGKKAISELDKNKTIENNKDDIVIFEYDAKYSGELYLRIDNQDVFKNNPIIYLKNNDEVAVYDFISKNSNWYAGEKEKLINVGYINTGKNKLEITIPNKGSFDLSKITLDLVNLDNYKNKIDNLKNEHLENVVFNKNGFKGSIRNEKNKLLFVSIPYGEGWSAFIDGKESKIIKANTGFMAVELSKGNHDVEFIYKRPLQNVGFISSILGILILIVFIVLKRRYGGEHRCLE